MRSTRHLLIGGGLACSRAARMLAAKDPGAAVTLVGKEPRLPYDRPALSKELLRGETTPEELVYDSKPFFDENHIELVLGKSVVELHPAKKTAVLDGGETIAFDKAFIATGGEPLRLTIPGSGLEGIHYLRTVGDALGIAADAAPGKRAAIIGAGFIGMEVAASLAQRGVDVTVIEALTHVWPGFLDESLARYIQDHCAARGVRFATGEKAASFGGRGRVVSVMTESGKEIPCDFVCVGIGISPEIGPAERAGLRVENGIFVNEFLQTSHPDIFAGGDVVNYPDPVFNRRRRVEHWGHAEYCGQVAALNMAGIRQEYDLLSYVWSDVFDLHIEFAGDDGEYDRILVRGRAGDPPFTVLYIKDNALRAYLGVNSGSREFPTMQRLIRRGVDLTGRDADLGDPSFDLKSLL